MQYPRALQEMEQVKVQPLLLTIKQVCETMNLGRNKVFALIKHEGLPTKRYGKAVRVPYEDLREWIRNH